MNVPGAYSPPYELHLYESADLGWRWSLSDGRKHMNGHAPTKDAALFAADKQIDWEKVICVQAAIRAEEARRAAVLKAEREATAARQARATTVLDAMCDWIQVGNLYARFGREKTDKELECLSMLGRLETSEGGFVRTKQDAWTGD